MRSSTPPASVHIADDIIRNVLKDFGFEDDWGALVKEVRRENSFSAVAQKTPNIDRLLKLFSPVLYEAVTAFSVGDAALLSQALSKLVALDEAFYLKAQEGFSLEDLKSLPVDDFKRVILETEAGSVVEG